MQIGKIKFPKLKLPRIKFAKTPLAFAVAFVVFSLVLSLAGPRIRIATVNEPTPQWGPNGRVISDPSGLITGDVRQALLVPGDAGSYIAFFESETDADHFFWKAQKFDASGSMQWDAYGINISDHVEDTEGNWCCGGNAVALSDGAGGAYFAWDSPEGVYSQRIMADGTLRFLPATALATSGPCATSSRIYNSSKNSAIVDDGAGGFIMIWEAGGVSHPPACVQRVDTDGIRMWGDGIVLRSSGTGAFVSAAIASDGAGGIIAESSNVTDLQIDHLDPAGNEISGCPQTVFTRQSGDNILVKNIIADGSGGAVAIFEAYNEPLKALHVSGACAADSNWPVNGAVITESNVWGGYVDATLSPNGIAFAYNASGRYFGGDTTYANMLSLADGTSVWGGEKSLGAGTSSAPIVSGSDLMYLMYDSKVMKLNGADGSVDPAFGASGLPAAPGGVGFAAISDGADGLVAVNATLSLTIQDMASDGTLSWPADDKLVDQEFIDDASSGHDWFDYGYGPLTAAQANGDKAVFWIDSLSNSWFGEKVAKIQIYDANGTAVLPGNGSKFFEWPTFGNNFNLQVVAVAADSDGYYLLLRKDETSAFVQKFDLNGSPLWGADGAPLSNTASSGRFYSLLSIAPDGSGGLYALNADGGWLSQIFVDHFSSDGSLPWGHSLAVGENNTAQGDVGIIQDGAGGAYAEFSSYRSAYGRVMVTRVSSAGMIDPGFDYPGLPVSNAGEWDDSWGAVSDGAGNAMIAYDSERDGQVYAQKIGPDGSFLWGANGRPVYGSGIGISWVNESDNYSLSSDGAGGLILPLAIDSYHEYAQRLDANGDEQWGNDVQTKLTAALAGGEDAIPVSSTDGFGDIGTVKIGNSFVKYSGKTAASFTGCVGAPAAANGSAVLQRIPLLLENNNDAAGSRVVGNLGGGVFAYETYLDGFYQIDLNSLDPAGNILYGGKIALTTDNIGSFVFPMIVGSNGSYLTAWGASSTEFGASKVYGQFITFPPPAPPYRWRNDDGTEASATFLRPDNAPLGSLARNIPARLRMTAGNDGTQSELIRKAAMTLTRGEDNIHASVIDTVHGYAYFACGTSPGQVVKVALGNGSDPPRRVGAVVLQNGENDLESAVIDTEHGYAYFGTNTWPGMVVKIALGNGDYPPTEVGALTLDDGEAALDSAVIDPDAGYAYFGTYTSPGRVVKIALGAGPALPTHVGAVALANGEDGLHSAVIDAAHGYAYFGTYYTSPGIVVKVALGVGNDQPIEVGAVTLQNGEENFWSAVIDATNGCAYFGTNTDPGIVVKIALGANSDQPTEVGALTLEDGEAELLSAVIDATNGYAYFGTGNSPGIIVKVALGANSDRPAEVGALTLNGEEDTLTSAVIDPTHGFAYFADQHWPVGVVKVALGSGPATPTRVGAATLISAEGSIIDAVTDPANGFGYFVARHGDEDDLIKVALGDGDGPPVRVGAVDFPSGVHMNQNSAVIDPAHGYAYFGSYISPGTIVKVALGAGNDPPTIVGTLTLNGGEWDITSAAIDTIHGYAYFSTNTSPGMVVKVALGANSDLPTEVGAVTLQNGEVNLASAVIDIANGYAYFGTNYTSPGLVVKVALGANSDRPTEVGALVVNQGEYGGTAVIDPANGYAYFGSNGSVIKVALGAGADLPTLIGSASLNEGTDWINSAVIDPANGFAYFATGNHPNEIVKVALGSGNALPRRVDAVALPIGSGAFLYSAAIDTTKGYAYFGLSENPGIIEKISIAPKAQFRLEYGLRTTSSCSDISSWIQVPTTAATESFQMYDSPNLTDGQPTTNVPGGLTDPAGGSFNPGQVKDTRSQTSLISLGEKQFTELEYSIQATTNASLGVNYCFRVTDAGTPTPLSESVYPEINLAHAPGNGGGGATPPVINGPVGNTNNNPSGGGGGGGNGNFNTNGNTNGNTNSNTNNPSGSPVEPGTTDTTYHFTNPGNADSFNLYDAPPSSSMRPLASNPDPTATTITETGLTPNTVYSNRVITAVANGSESSPSPSFPTFATLLTNFDTITATYDPIAKTVSLTATGTLPNLTVGQSGVDFTVKNGSGTVLFDSGFVQTPSPGSLASANLEPGETYTVTVTPRNQNGDLSPSQDFTVTIPAGEEIKAKITLTKSAEKTDFPSSVNALTRETAQNTKEIKYTITASNTGNGITKTFVMTDPLPQGIDLKAGSINVVKNLNDVDDVVNASYDPDTRTVTASLDELEPGESFTVTFVATPSPNTASSTVRNKASASWEE